MSEEFQLGETLRDIYIYLHQHVDTPTRGRGTNRPGRRDLVHTNEEGVVDTIDYFSPLGKSDHSLLSCNLICYVARRQQVRRRFIYGKGDYNKMKDMHVWRRVFGKIKWHGDRVWWYNVNTR